DAKSRRIACGQLDFASALVKSRDSLARFSFSRYAVSLCIINNFSEELVPQHHFDIVFARREDGIPPRFIGMLEREARARGMIFVHCRNHDQAETLRHALMDGSLTVDCLIDYMGRSFRHDYELGCAVKDSGGIVLDDPDRVRIYGDKAVMHYEL